MSAAGSQKGDFLSENPLVSAQATDSKAAPPQHRQERSRKEPGLHGSMSIAATAAAAMMATHHRLKSSKRNSMLTGGFPAREALQTIHKIVRDKAIREALIFLMYTILFLGILYEVNNVHVSYSQNNAVLDLFLDEEFEDATYKKNFFEVMTMEEMWTWLKGPLYNGAYPDEWYNGVPYSEDELGYTLMYLRLVGGIQLRQARVSNQSCAIRRFVDECVAQPDGTCQARFDTKDGTCFSEFSVSRQDTQPYGPGTEGFTWSSGHSDLKGLFGFGPDYGDGGYIATMPLDRTEALALLNNLEANLWTDRGTRVVAVDFNLYNTNSRLLTVARVRFEFFPNAHLQTSFKFFSFRILVYSSRTDMVRMAFEIAFCLFWGYHVQKEARRLYHRAPPRVLYFTDLRNVYELVLILVALIIILEWLSFVRNPLRTDFDVNSASYVDMFEFANNYSDAFSLAGFFTLLLFLKGFRYLGISKRMNALWLTLRSAASDLVTFTFGTMVVVAGFAYFAQMAFGTLLVDFHSFLASMSTLMRYPLGDFDYKELSRARPAVAPIFFGSYMGIVFFVLSNMFVAIVTRHFEEVHDGLRTGDKWKESSVTWEAVQMQRVARKLRAVCDCCLKFRRSRKRRADSQRLEDDEPSEESWSAAHSEAQAQLDHESDKLADQGLDLQTNFERLLHMCMRQAKRVHAIELMTYFEGVYKTKGASRMYIGTHELCYLTQKQACEPGQHPVNKCLGFRTVEAYHKIKVVLMVGLPRLHKPVVHQATQTMHRFHCVKINKNGRKQQRVMVVDPKGYLLNLSPSLALRKQLPLAQLVQLEFSSTNKTKATLVFTSVGLSMDADLELGGIETLYQLYMKTREERNEFITLLLEAHQRAISGTASAASSAQATRRKGLTAKAVLAASKTESASRAAKLREAALRRRTSSGGGALRNALANVIHVDDGDQRGSAQDIVRRAGNGNGHSAEEVGSATGASDAGQVSLQHMARMVAALKGKVAELERQAAAPRKTSL